MMKFILLYFTFVFTLIFTVSCVPWGPSPFGSGWRGGMGGMDQMMGGGMVGQGSRQGGSTYNPEARPITIDQAADAVRRYISNYRGGLALKELMEFGQNFYAEVEEKDTGIHATELLIDKYTGQVYPEMGPNMMWNAKYGPMSQMMGSYAGGPPASVMPVTPEQSKELAQKWLDVNLPGIGIAEADTFYGYYTLHTLKGGKVEGMLSVNGYSGAVWYHNWHGPFIGIKEFHDER